MPSSLVASGLQTGEGRGEVGQMNKLPPILPDRQSLLLQNPFHSRALVNCSWESPTGNISFYKLVNKAWELGLQDSLDRRTIRQTTVEKAGEWSLCVVSFLALSSSGGMLEYTY